MKIEKSKLCNIAYLLCLIFTSFLAISVVVLATREEDYQTIVITASGIVLMLVLAAISKMLKAHYDKIEFIEFLEDLKQEDNK